MRDFSSWSVSLHRWWGIHVRLHAWFLFFSVAMIYLATRDVSVGIGYGCLALAILLVSVLAHEIGHCAAAFRLGGHAEQIVIGPLGGLSFPQVAHDPQQELFTALAGPIVTLVIWLVTGPLVPVSGGSLLALMNPLEPQGLFTGPVWAVAVKLTFWINWLLLLVNLVPAAPLDGARVLRALFWRASDYKTAVVFVARAAQFVAIGLCIAAWLSRESFDSTAVPAWLPLSLMAIYLYFVGRQEIARIEEKDIEDELFSYDFSQGYTSLERHYDGPRRKSGRLRGWIERRRHERRQKQVDIERQEERQLDEILARLHEKGIDGLSAKERALLNRVSEDCATGSKAERVRSAVRLHGIGKTHRFFAVTTHLACLSGRFDAAYSRNAS